ncbi:hypothetical protein QBC32DRAFT_220868 [Pseudoneurospora amorphoporcata]|uniref:Uncharacterized protein n=1 Tax=Pseudoneurospora amorphoporcata TaxID=241081 RepID=A0AAN6NN41_9PEZI|nr:hypothetical protein QBC32DRAFT_220868 [Pseudoneurospora amorphoporcata]
MATYPRQTAWTHDVSRMSLEAASEGLNDASTNVRPAGTQPSKDIRNHAYHEEIAQHHVNRGEEDNSQPYDNDDYGTLGEDYLHTNGDLEEFAGDPNYPQSPITDEKNETEDQNNYHNIDDDETTASDHASAGNSPKETGGDASFHGGGIKLKRNNSNSAELMLQGVSSRSPTSSQQSLLNSQTFGYNLGGYFQSCEDCFVAGLRCVHLTAAAATIILPDGRGSLVRNGDGDGRAARERHEWLVERMKESLAKIDCAGGNGSVVSRKGA